MKKLNISPDLSLPVDAVTQTLVVYGSKGMGKTNFGSVFAEELYGAGQRFSVIDPMGVWWGLQHGARRGEPGLEVLLLGGVHGDLPIEPTGGEVVADLVADEAISVVVDISRRPDGRAWSKGEKVRFVTSYMTRLYARQVEHRRPLMQIIDEAARYAPQGLRSGDVDESKCLGAIAMVCEEGRNLGIGLTLLTQRSARLNKDVAELADVLVAFRTVGPNSVGAITDWLGDHVARERHKEIVEQLRQLPVGTALVISPGWLGFEGVVPVRARQTFDSSATPKAGQALQAPGRATKPDLEKYRARMTETIERAKENDPREQKKKVGELTRKVAELEAALEEAKTATAPAETQRVEVPVIKPAELIRIEAVVKELDSIAGRAEELIQNTAGLSGRFDEARAEVKAEAGRLAALIERATAAPAELQPSPPARSLHGAGRPTAPLPRATRPAAAVSGDGKLSGPAQRILDELARFEAFGIDEPDRANVAVFVGYHQRSKSFTNSLSSLHTAGLIEYPDAGKIALTREGRARARPGEPIHSRRELHEAWYQQLGAGTVRARMLRLIIEAHPDAVGRAELAGAMGYHPRSKSFTNALSSLSGLKLVRYPREGYVEATALLFPEGLR
ncbi:MAG TPA: hypothetical protein VGX48_17790 [Pyrinomonadaceae bacterium]|nr:hypothetical protein [Pyrinomonadaceae bacterium]